MVYGILRRIFVERCPACGESSPGGFCPVCAAEFARMKPACRRCGLALPVARCPRGQIDWRIDALVAPFTYCAPLDFYMHRLKYRRARALGRAFGLLLLEEARAALAGADALVAVPLSRARLLERGYNQAQEIARTLGGAVRLPALERGVARRAVATQTGRSAADRRLQMTSGFHVTRDMTGRCVAIIDDVVTTGATVNALAAALRAAGAARCTVLAVARAPEPGQPRNV